MKVEAFDDGGNAVYNQQGELVCLAPFPSMPIYFWEDPEGLKYQAAYFSVYPSVWRHGDYIEINDRGGVVIYGRSDATLNPSGVRIGTAEIYRQVERLDEIVESIVIGQRWDDDVRVVLFVVLQPGVIQTNQGTTIRGGRANEEAVFIDGVLIRSFGQAAANNVNLPTNALEQVDVNVGAFAAEFGEAQSGVVSFVTRSGGPQFTGSLEFFTDQLAPSS